MKSIKSYLLIAALSLSAVSVAKSRSQLSKIVANNFTVECTSCKPPTTITQPAKANKDGTFSVDLPGPGNFTIKYAEGPHKGDVITKVTATKAGSKIIGNIRA